MWLLQGCAWYCEKLRELGLSASTEASLRACQERLHTLMSSTKNRALVHIARLEEQGVLVLCVCLSLFEMYQRLPTTDLEFCRWSYGSALPKVCENKRDR